MRCNRCLNDSSVRNITFDKDGICNYCRDYEKIKDKLNDYNNLEKLFIERINNIKGTCKYDVALGISGGKDSLFVLNELINKYKLKVKTFTMNNGFLTDTAKKNIDKIVTDFNIEHEYINFDKNLLYKVYHHSMKHWLVPCIACSYIGYATMIGYTNKINAGMCIHGRSPEQMLRYYNKDIFSTFVNLGLKHIHEIDLNLEYTKLLESIKNKINKEIFSEIKNIAFNGKENVEFKEFVPYFLYHKYDEDYIVKYLKEHTNWNPPKDYNHYDCYVHNATKYIYQCAEGRPHRLPEISVLVRSNIISREKALQLLEGETIQDKPTKEIKDLCTYTNINDSMLYTKAWIYNKVKKLKQ